MADAFGVLDGHTMQTLAADYYADVNGEDDAVSLSRREVSSMRSRERSGSFKAPANFESVVIDRYKSLYEEATTVLESDTPIEAVKSLPFYEWSYESGEGRSDDDIIMLRERSEWTLRGAEDRVKLLQAWYESAESPEEFAKSYRYTPPAGGGSVRVSVEELEALKKAARQA